MSTQRQNAIKLLPPSDYRFCFFFYLCILFPLVTGILIWHVKELLCLLILNITSYFQNLLNIRKTVTGVVTDFLDASRPAAEAMLIAFQELEKRCRSKRNIKESSSFWVRGCCKKFTGLNSKALRTAILKALNPVCTLIQRGN